MKEDDMKYTTLVSVMGFTMEHGRQWLEDVTKAIGMNYFHDGLEYLIRKYSDRPRELAMVTYGFGVAVTNASWHKASVDTRNRIIINKMLLKAIQDLGIDPSEVAVIEITRSEEDHEAQKHL